MECWRCYGIFSFSSFYFIMSYAGMKGKWSNDRMRERKKNKKNKKKKKKNRMNKVDVLISSADDKFSKILRSNLHLYCCRCVKMKNYIRYVHYAYLRSFVKIQKNRLTCAVLSFNIIYISQFQHCRFRIDFKRFAFLFFQVSEK